MNKSLYNKIYLLSEVYGKKLGLDLPYFIKNGFWVTLRQGVGIVTGLCLSVVFARLSTQDVFGQYQFVLSLLSIASIFSIPGLNNSLIQSVVNGCDGDYKKVVRTSFLWSLLGVPVLLATGAFYYIYQDHSLGIALMVTAIFFPFFYAPNTWDSFLQGKSRFDISAKYSSIQSIINMIATIAVIFFYRDNLIVIVSAYLVSYSFFNGYYYYRSLRYVENEQSDGAVIKYGWFLTKISILNLIASNLDKIAVGVFLSPAQLAVYSIGTLLPKQIQNVTKSILWITVPKQIKQGDISRGNYIKVILISFGVFLLVWFLSPVLIGLLFSQKYEESIELTRISFLFFPLYAASVLYHNKFIFNRIERNVKIESVASPLIRIALIFLVLPSFGIQGLAFLFGFQYVTTLTVLYVTDRFFSKRP